MIPQQIAELLVGIGMEQGAWLFLMLTIVILIIFGAVLEGAPALIIFAPILVPIAIQLGFNPLHFGIVMIMAMGFGLFSPPIGLGLYTTCAICGVEMKHVISGGGFCRHHYCRHGTTVNHLAARTGRLLIIKSCICHARVAGISTHKKRRNDVTSLPDAV